MMILLLIFLLLVTVTLDINPFPYTTLFRSHVGVVPLRGDLGPADGGIHLDAGHVGVAHLVGELGGVGSSALDLEAAGVPQRGLVTVVPTHPGAAPALVLVQQCVGTDHQVGQQDRAARPGPGPVLEVGVGDAELRLDAHHPLGGQPRHEAPSPISWSWVGRSGSSGRPSRPWSGTTASIRRPRRPETRAHSSGWEAEGMSSFSLNSAAIASCRCREPTPATPVASCSLTAYFLARSTMLRSVAPETKSRKWRVSAWPSEYSMRTKAESGPSAETSRSEELPSE